MHEQRLDLDDFRHIAAGAAILAGGGGGSYHDMQGILAELAERGGYAPVALRDYDGRTDACVLAIMGSPDAADAMTLEDIEQAISNTLAACAQMGFVPGCAIAVETGPINSLVPLIAAALGQGQIAWVVDGDGAARAVPELPQTTFGGCPELPAGPGVVADDSGNVSIPAESAILNACSAARMEALAGGVLSAFGGYAGVALWPSTAANGHALREAYIPGTLSQALALGRFLRSGATPRGADEVATHITGITGRKADLIAHNLYITEVMQTTTSASLDTGLIRLDNTPDPHDSTLSVYIYNLNENLLMYSNQSSAPLALAPDAICYYSERTGAGFSNATDDLAPYYDFSAGRSTGCPVSVIRVAADKRLVNAPGVMSSFAQLLRDLGYAGALPTTRSEVS